MRVALYPRVSGHEQEDNYSIPEQIDRMQKYCESRDWTVYKIYTDSGFSGSTLERPGLKQLIKDAEAQRVDMVLVYKLDRLSRSQKDVLFLVEDVFEKHGVAFTSMTENFDTSTPFGKAILGILAVFAQLERSQIRERTMIGKKARAEEGKWHGSKWLPLGYDYVDGELVINEYEAMQIREIAELFIAYTPVRRIAITMGEKGYKHRHGTWDAKTIRRVLSNPAIIGKLRYRDKVYEGTHRPLIDQATFDKIQEIMNARKEKYGTSYKPHVSLLGGFIFCKHCGARYAREYNGKTRRAYYACYSRSKRVARMVKDPNCPSKYIYIPDLDTLVLGEIAKLAVDPAYIQDVRDRAPISEYMDKIKAINLELEKIDSQISKLMDLYSLGAMSIDLINQKVAALNETKMKLEKEMDGLNVTEDGEELSDEQITDLAAALTDDLDLEAKRRIVQSLIHFIEIGTDEVIIHWKF